MSTPVPGALIQVGEVLNDPDVCQEFQVLRSAVTWLNGVAQNTTVPLDFYGAISIAKSRDLAMVPEGDKISEAIVCWSTQELLGTHATEGIGGLSDLIVWRGLQWRVLECKYYSDYGYWRAVATRLKTD